MSTTTSDKKLKLLSAALCMLPVLPTLLFTVGLVMLLSLPAIDTRVNVHDESNLRNRGYRSQVVDGDVRLSREALMEGVPSVDTHRVMLKTAGNSSTEPPASYIDIVVVPGSRSPGTEHFAVFSMGTCHRVAIALAHSFAHQPFMSMDLRFYFAPPSMSVDEVAGAAGLPEGMIRGVLQLNFTGGSCGASAVCVHSFGVGALQPNQDLLNVFTAGLRAHGSTPEMLCHTKADMRRFTSTTVSWNDWFFETTSGIMTANNGEGKDRLRRWWLVGALHEYTIGPLSTLVHDAFEAGGGAPSRAGNMRTRVSHTLLYGLEVLRSGELGRYGGGRLRATMGLHTVGLSDVGLPPIPPARAEMGGDGCAIASLRIARGVEHGIRCVNNLDERLHHSSPVWLSSSANTFSDFTIGQIISFLFTGGCVAIALSVALRVPNAGVLMSSLVSGVVSLVVVYAIVFAMLGMTTTISTPQVAVVIGPLWYVMLTVIRGYDRASSHPFITVHFPVLVVLSMLGAGLIIILVAQHPPLSLFGGCALLAQLLALTYTSNSGLWVPQRRGVLVRCVVGMAGALFAIGAVCLSMAMVVLIGDDTRIIISAYLSVSIQITMATIIAVFL